MLLENWFKVALGRRFFTPCDNCLVFFLRKLLWRHRINCTDSKGHPASSQNMLIANLRIDLNLTDTILPRMRADEVSLVAKKDSFICTYYARYIKIHMENHFMNVNAGHFTLRY